MNSTWKAKTITLAVLSLGILFQPYALGYDESAFPGIGRRSDFDQSCRICLKGASYLESGKARQSIPFFKQAISIYPYSAAFYYNMGSAYHSLDEHKNALNAYKNAIRLAPDYAPAYSNLSDIQFRMKDFHGAEINAQKATKLSPKSASALINLAQAELALKKARLAKQHIQIAKSLPDAQHYSEDLQAIDVQIKNILAKTAEN